MCPSGSVSLVHACASVCVSYLEGEPVLARTEPHVVHWRAVDHHLGHVFGGQKHYAAGGRERERGSMWGLVMTFQYPKGTPY